jgi:hypothetical protein
VRIGISSSFAALAVCATTAEFSQTTAPPSAPSQTPPVSSPDTTQTLPAYAPQGQTKTQQTAPPAAPPVAPTPETPYRAFMPYEPPEVQVYDRHAGSVYIPVDSWMYPELTRLYSMGYLDTMFLGMRPWTRRVVLHMLQASQQAIVTSNDDEAQQILAKLLTELDTEVPDGSRPRGAVYGLESSYTRLMGIGGPVLRQLSPGPDDQQRLRATVSDRLRRFGWSLDD